MTLPPPDIDPGPFDDEDEGPAPFWAWPVAFVLAALPLTIIAHGLLR